MKKTKEEQTWKLFITSTDKKEVQELLDKYEVNYILLEAVNIKI